MATVGLVLKAALISGGLLSSSGISSNNDSKPIDIVVDYAPDRRPLQPGSGVLMITSRADVALMIYDVRVAGGSCSVNGPASDGGSDCATTRSCPVFADPASQGSKLSPITLKRFESLFLFFKECLVIEATVSTSAGDYSFAWFEAGGFRPQ